METLVINIVAGALMVAGLIGTIVPVLPGIGLIFAGILVHAIFIGTEQIGLVTLVVFGVATILSAVFDFLASAYGASRFGASRWGAVGSIVGGIVGFLAFNFPGLVLGVFFGAAAGELGFARKDLRQSFRAGWGSVLGFLASSIIKFLLGIGMILVFLFRVVW